MPEKLKTNLRTIGLLLLVIFGGNFAIQYFRQGVLDAGQGIVGAIGLVMLIAGGVVTKNRVDSDKH